MLAPESYDLVLDKNTSATKAVVNTRTLTSLRTAAGML